MISNSWKYFGVGKSSDNISETEISRWPNENENDVISACVILLFSNCGSDAIFVSLSKRKVSCSYDCSVTLVRLHNITENLKNNLNTKTRMNTLGYGEGQDSSNKTINNNNSIVTPCRLIQPGGSGSSFLVGQAHKLDPNELSRFFVEHCSCIHPVVSFGLEAVALS